MSSKEIIQTLYEVPPPSSSTIALDKPKNVEVFLIEKQEKSKKKIENVLYEVSPPREKIIKKNSPEFLEIEILKKNIKTAVGIELIENPKPKTLIYEVPKQIDILPSPDHITLESVRLPKPTRNFNPFKDYTNTPKIPQGRKYRKYDPVYDNNFSDGDFPRYFDDSVYGFSEPKMHPYNGNYYNNNNTQSMPRARGNLIDVYPDYEYETDFRNENPSQRFAELRKQQMNENAYFKTIKRNKIKPFVPFQIKNRNFWAYLLLLPIAFLFLEGFMLLLWHSCKKLI
jgi:hypothetical protein